MGMTHPRVECIVNTCVHYLPGKVCGASAIEVRDRGARDVEHTDCVTYARRTDIGGVLHELSNVNVAGAVEQALTSRRAVNPNVKCIVDTCKYYVQGDLCDAEAIRITGSAARAEKETECSTFEERPH